MTQIADGAASHEAVRFSCRALPGYVNRWIPCSAIMLQVAPTGEAEIVVKAAIGELDLTDDGVHAP